MSEDVQYVQYESRFGTGGGGHYPKILSSEQIITLANISGKNS